MPEHIPPLDTRDHCERPPTVAAGPCSWPTLPLHQLSPRLNLASFFSLSGHFTPRYHTPGLHLYLVLTGAISQPLPDGRELIVGPGQLVCMRHGDSHYSLLDQGPVAYYQIHMQPQAELPEAVPWLDGVGALPWRVDLREDLPEAIRLFEQAIALLVALSPTWELDAAATLSSLLALIFRHAPTPAGGSAAAADSASPGRLNRWERLLARLEHDGEMPQISQLATEFGLSTAHFIRAFHAYVGRTPKQYLLQRRLWRARRRLEQGRSVKDAALSVGYHDALHFSRMYRRMFGFPPSQTPPPGDAEAVGPPASSLPISRHLMRPGVEMKHFRC